MQGCCSPCKLEIPAAAGWLTRVHPSPTHPPHREHPGVESGGPGPAAHRKMVGQPMRQPHAPGCAAARAAVAAACLPSPGGAPRAHASRPSHMCCLDTCCCPPPPPIPTGSASGCPPATPSASLISGLQPLRPTTTAPSSPRGTTGALGQCPVFLLPSGVCPVYCQPVEADYHSTARPCCLPAAVSQPPSVGCAVACARLCGPGCGPPHAHLPARRTRPRRLSPSSPSPCFTSPPVQRPRGDPGPGLVLPLRHMERGVHPGGAPDR